MILSRSRSRRHAFRLRRSKLLRQASPSHVRKFPQSSRKLPNSLARRPERSPDEGPEPKALAASPGWEPAGHARKGGTFESEPTAEQGSQPSPTAQVLALFADPRVVELSPPQAAQKLGIPLQDASNIFRALAQAGYLQAKGQLQDRYVLTPDKKVELEHMFRATMRAVHDPHGLAPTASHAGSELSRLQDTQQEDDPRMPMTAGILSLFLPGTGQLLNGDIGRAVLVFAIWALAILAPHPAIIIFVRLYAGAEAFFNAKLRRLAQKRALEAAQQRSLAALPASSGGSL